MQEEAETGSEGISRSTILQGGSQLEIHQITVLVFDPGNHCPVHYDTLPGESPGQIVLTHGGIAFQTVFPNSCADDVIFRRFAGFLHGVCFHTLDF